MLLFRLDAVAEENTVHTNKERQDGKILKRIIKKRKDKRVKQWVHNWERQEGSKSQWLLQGRVLTYI